jgi:hypothetical protein
MVGPEGNPPALPSNWMDSDRALSFAEEHGGREARKHGHEFDILPSLEQKISDWRARWTVEYLISDARGRNDLLMRFDAIDGGNIERR